jgi:hypothetical protein
MKLPVAASFANDRFGPFTTQSLIETGTTAVANSVRFSLIF